jgi:SAM-dependent methyltransferase
MLKDYLRKIKILVIIFCILKNYKAKLLFSFKFFKQKSGAMHSALAIDQNVNYIFDVFNDYLYYGRLREEDLIHKEILEVGPGNNLGVALLFLAKGAKRVVCWDKFNPVENIAQQIQIYKSLKYRLNAKEKKRYDDCIEDIDKLAFNPTKLMYTYGKGIEDADLKNESYDLIVSRAVLEHIYNIDRAFSLMQDSLKPKGIFLHKIDLRDHGIFSSSGMNPLTFLTISPKIWRMMSEYSGRPNRKRIDYYRRIFNQNRFDTTIFITHIVGLPNELIPHRKYSEYVVNDNDDTLNLIKEIRPQLSPEFRILSDKDLAISGIFLVARKSK